MKKTLSLLSVSLLFVVAMILGVSADVTAPTNEIISSGECGDNLTWFLDSEGTLTVNGTGNMSDWEWISSPLSYAPWDSDSDLIKNIVISDGVTSIGSFAFTDCINLVSATIPDSVKYIGPWAFAGCENLACEINLSNVEEIGNQAFFSCKALTVVNISGGVESLVIGAFAFAGCNSLTSASFSVNAAELYINEHAFFACTELESVKFSGGLSYIDVGEYAFSECRSLADVYCIVSEEELHINDNNDSLTNTTIHYNYEKTYTVTYDANGGSGAPSEQTKNHDEALTLSSTVPTRTGYTFKGWATSITGSVAYASGASYTANASVTLYAVWANDNVTNKVVYGDVNGDEKVTISDAISILQYIASGDELRFNETQKKAADVIVDENVTISDVIRILQYIANPDAVTLGPKGMLQFFKEFGEAEAEMDKALAEEVAKLPPLDFSTWL